MKNSLFTKCLFVCFFIAAGTAFSQTAQDTGEISQGFPQGVPYPDGSSHINDTKDIIQADWDSGEFTQAEPDEKDDDTIPPTVPAKPNTITAEKTKAEGLPQWAKDLRRGEIIAFGSLPFTFFFTQTFMDLYRMSSHGWDSRYAPGLFKGAGAIPMTDTELKIMFGITISASVLIAVVDYFIVRHKRNKAEALQQQ